jgi:hypothetical protein
MKKSLVAAIGWLLSATLACAQTPLTTLFVGPGTSAVATPYTGPGDLGFSFLVWYGLRAYSSATRGNRAINVCNAGDATCVDMVTSATTGDLVVTTVGGTDCGVSTCTVKLVYDQTGATTCSGGCTLGNATESGRPVLTLNCINTTFPCLTYSAGKAITDVSGGIFPTSYAQPVTMSVVFDRTGGVTSFGNIWSSASSFGILGNNAANQITLFAGVVFPVTAANDNTWHAAQGIFNNATSTMYVDGSSGTVDIMNSSNITSTALRTGGSNDFLGKWVESGFITSGLSGAQLIAINGNQHTYWGF